MGSKTDIVGNNAAHSYSFSFIGITYKISTSECIRIFSLRYKIFLLNYMRVYFMLFCKMQIRNALVFQEFFQ